MSAARVIPAARTQPIPPPSREMPAVEIPPPARTPTTAPRQGRVSSPDAAAPGTATRRPPRPGARLAGLLSVMSWGGGA